ncbi:hypothetical protein RLO149_c001340 [Roseobacter litoralis Och 149]|uniref:Uncharacterized protein n=1 Tax=Roseobacter litoralis (strain ATCC 49566 / DSM 6996 / JCM 21268 / NBRC 15278 / OCh 149) TaxID=391595 RepID=F7ZET5_ROSLO|nr:hypothetical protein RLO149_c001340 [Roseobacter litoralis Och 149]
MTVRSASNLRCVRTPPHDLGRDRTRPLLGASSTWPLGPVPTPVVQAQKTDATPDAAQKNSGDDNVHRRCVLVTRFVPLE